MKPTQAIHITNGRVIDPASGLDDCIDLYLEHGTISSLGESPAGFKADRVIDAAGAIVCPGLVDLSARLREPGQEHKATIASETLAAAKGGITTLCCPPDTNPVADTTAVANLIIRSAKHAANARVLPIGAITQNLEGSKLSEMAALTQAGCVAVSNGDIQLASTLVERRAMEYASTFNIPVILRPEDRELKDGGCAHEGPVSSRLGLPGIPETAETVAVARDLALAEQTGCRLHFHALSSGAGARMLERGQQQRMAVTADVAIHQLHLTEMDIEEFDSNCHVSPPLRSLMDRDMLRDAVSRGVIGAICSDHQPHEADAKETPFPSTLPGISGLETLLPLTLKLVDEHILTLPQALARLTCDPADILGLPYGRIRPGASADICIFDPEAYWELMPEQMISAGLNTPFMSWELKGKVTHTLFEGRIVFEQ
jgi:dihydroorotase